jgi:hypothetical protein
LPGMAECVEYGWWTRFVAKTSKWMRCQRTDANAMPDYNRLLDEGVWDANSGKYRCRIVR